MASDGRSNGASSRPPIRQTRARSRLSGAPPLMRGLDDRGHPIDQLPEDPRRIPASEVRRQLNQRPRIILRRRAVAAAPRPPIVRRRPAADATPDAVPAPDAVSPPAAVAPGPVVAGGPPAPRVPPNYPQGLMERGGSPRRSPPTGSLDAELLQGAAEQALDRLSSQRSSHEAEDEGLSDLPDYESEPQDEAAAPDNGSTNRPAPDADRSPLSLMYNAQLPASPAFQPQRDQSEPHGLPGYLDLRFHTPSLRSQRDQSEPHGLPGPSGWEFDSPSFQPQRSDSERTELNTDRAAANNEEFQSESPQTPVAARWRGWVQGNDIRPSIEFDPPGDDIEEAPSASSRSASEDGRNSNSAYVMLSPMLHPRPAAGPGINASGQQVIDAEGHRFRTDSSQRTPPFIIVTLSSASPHERSSAPPIKQESSDEKGHSPESVVSDTIIKRERNSDGGYVDEVSDPPLEREASVESGFEADAEVSDAPEVCSSGQQRKRRRSDDDDEASNVSKRSRSSSESVGFARYATLRTWP